MKLIRSGLMVACMMFAAPASTFASSKISELQSLLTNRGFYQGPLNGSMDLKTLRALGEAADALGIPVQDATPDAVITALQERGSVAVAVYTGSTDPAIIRVDRQRNAAFAREDPTISLSRYTSRDSKHPYHNPLTLLTEDGVPTLAFKERWFNGRFVTLLSFECRPAEQIEITAILRRSTLAEQGQSLDMAGSHELLIRPYGLNVRARVPARFAGWADSAKSLAHFAASLPADHRLLTGLDNTTNFQINLYENGRNAPFSGGSDIVDAATHLMPLLYRCAGRAAPVPTPETTLPPLAEDRWSPSEADIRHALQAEADERLRQMDEMAAACENVAQSQNPFQAMACIASSASGLSSKNTTITVLNVDLDRCYRMEGGSAYCNYDADSDIRAPGPGGSLLEAATTLSREIDEYGWGNFELVDGRWYLERKFESCTVNLPEETFGGSINCTYLK